MLPPSIWISGASRSGKTTRLVDQLCTWVRDNQALLARYAQSAIADAERKTRPLLQAALPPSLVRSEQTGILVFAANGDSRIALSDQIAIATQGRYSIYSTTPLGFFQDEVLLFWPLLLSQLSLKVQFPLKLRPENEQDLAARFWRSHIDLTLLQQSGLTEQQFIRRSLDFLQLAALAGISLEDIPVILERGMPHQSVSQTPNLEPFSDLNQPLPWQQIGQLLMQWRNWCLEQGFLTYGIISELYSRYLLPNPVYQTQLIRRYRIVLADDVDNYPAIARHLFEQLLNAGAVGAFTYDPDGAVRLGLGADPTYLAGLAEQCQVEVLNQRPTPSLAEQLDIALTDWLYDPTVLASLPEQIRSIQTTSRGQLLRKTAEVITDAVKSGQVQPQDIAVIAPGLDAIARYTLMQILGHQQIRVESLNDQRPLSDSPTIRALLTLLALVYPGLGRLVDRDAVTEMLVVLSQKPLILADQQPSDDSTNSSASDHSPYLIDPIRAGLIVDHCFEPHPDSPRLLPLTTFPRWDRLGYQGATTYQAIVQWLESQILQQEQRLIPSPVSLLDRAIQRFLWNGSYLPYDQLAALRELLETAQHYWEVDTRLRQSQQLELSLHETVGHFIQLLRSGTITANPYPVRPLGAVHQTVTLATVFQYRSSRRTHRWQFWLDAGSPRWLSGVDALLGAPLFLQDWSGQPWTAEDAMNANEQRLRRILLDLLGRTTERIYLCHSDLATNGQEQTGPLLSFVNASLPWGAEVLSVS